jgi:hypothetical protein
MQPASGSVLTAGQAVNYVMYGFENDGWSSMNDYLILEVTPTAGSQPWNNVCNVQYQPATNIVYLTLNSGSQWSQGTLGSGGVLSNSQCSVNVSGGYVTRNGGGITLTLPITFASTYTGTQYQWIGMYEGSLYFYSFGSVTVQAPQNATASLSQPLNGATATAGSAVTYSVYGYEPDYWGSTNDYLILEVSPTLGSEPWNGVCNVQFQPATNTVFLTLDSGSQWSSGTPGSGAVLSNSQCSIALSGTTVSRTGGGVTLTMPITFTTGYEGTKYNYVALYEGGFTWFYFGAISVQAPAPAQYYLTTTASPSGEGSIYPASGWYNSGSVVAITATPNSGYRFSGFTGALTGTANPQNLTVTGTATVTANFMAIPPAQFQLTTAVSPPGAGSITPACSSGCLYNSGSGVTVSAAANTGYTFSGWSGSGSGSYSGAASSATVTMNGPISETANFVTAIPPPVITSLSTSSGLVSSAVQISGNNFGGSQGTSTVTFNGTPAPIIIFYGQTMWTPTSIWVTVPNGATSGNVVVTVGGAASSGAPFTVTVAPLGPKTSLHVTVGALPVSWYDYSHLAASATTTFSTYACPSGSSVRGCFQSFLKTLAGQGVTGVREYITLCDITSQAFTNGQNPPSCDPTLGTIAVDPNWVANLATFFSDVQAAGISNVAITPTVGVSTGWSAFPVSETISPATKQGFSCADGSPNGNCCIDTPGAPGFVVPPNYPNDGHNQVYFHPIIPFGMNAFGNPIGDTTVTGANNNGYVCAPINNKNFIGWSNVFSLIDAMLGAAQGKVNITQLELLQAEMNLYESPAQLRYIVDTYPGHAITQPSPSCSLTGTDVLCELRARMTSHQFDPGRVAWSASYMDPVDNADNCTNVYTDYGRNTAVDEMAAAIGGSVIGNPLGPVTTGFPCGGDVSGMFQVPYYNTQPSIIDAHIYPSIVKSPDLGGGAPEQNQSTPDQSQAVIQAVARTDYSDLTHLLTLVPSLQSAEFVIGETYYGTMYPGVVPGFSTTLCWSAPTSAPAANALGFEQSALFGYPVIFRPFMTLEDASGGCFAYGNGPASTYTYPDSRANYQNVNLNGQGPYVPTKQ